MRKLLLYGANGLLNTLVTYMVYLALLRVVDFRVALVIAYGLGVLLAYVVNGAVVFRRHGSFAFFAAVNVALLGVNVAITWAFVDLAGWRRDLAPLPAVLTVFLLGFLINKHFVFRHHRRIPTTSR